MTGNEMIIGNTSLATTGKFYTLNQNNSGGSFDFNEEYGITHYIKVEGDNLEHIETRLRDIINTYPNRGGDCECCGDRWDTSIWSEDDLDDVPMIYSQTVEEFSGGTGSRWFDQGKSVCVHYKDGRMAWF